MLYRLMVTLFAGFFFINSVRTQSMPFWGAKAPLPLETPIDSLKHGEFTWAPEVAPEGPILVVVSLDEQRAYTYRNGLLIGVATVSTGKPGHLTPTGVFTTLQKDVNHHSSIYDDASMPYTQRLTEGGIALHAGGLPGYPSSHGCVHLPSEYARLLFQASPLGMTVVITNSKSEPAQVDHPDFLSPVDVKGKLDADSGLTATEDFRWQPETSPDGPLSIIISRYDQRMIVMRNGIEIGRSKVSFLNPQDSIGTHILIAHTHDTKLNDSTLKWMGLDFNNLEYQKDKWENALNDKRIIIPQQFLASLTPAIAPGTSVVLTDAPILENVTTGVGLTLLTSNPSGG